MFVFASRMFRDKVKSFIIYSISSVVLLEMYVALFPAISKQSAQVDQLLKVMPAELFEAMNMDLSSLSFGNMQSYLSTEYMSFLWPIVAIIFAISIANYLCVNEIDNGTIETLASLPVNRTKIFLERYFVGLLMIAGFCAVSLFGAIPLAIAHGVSYVLANYLTASIGSFFFVWAIYSLATLFSTIFSERGRASMVTSGIIILSYAINVISTLDDDIKNIQYGSLFHYFNGTELLAKNHYPDFALLVLGGFAIVMTTIALIRFSKRDLSV